MRVVVLFTRRSELCYYVYIFLVMSTYFCCRLLHFGVMYVSCVLLTNGAAILFWVCMWYMWFNMSVRPLDVKTPGYWWLEFGKFYFSTSARQSNVEPTSSWCSYFGPPGSWLMSVLVGTITLSTEKILEV